MRVSYDRSTDIMTLEPSEEKIDHAEEVENIIIHLSEDGKPTVLEILDSSELLPQLVGMIQDPNPQNPSR